MRVGVWMPTAMPFEPERSFFLDWVRLADQAGFDTVSSLDRLNYDMWDPLASLAGAAAVTQRIRLGHHHPATAKPQRGVRRQASRGDRRPFGRPADARVSLGSWPDDYQVFGATLEQCQAYFLISMCATPSTFLSCTRSLASILPTGDYETALQ
jgi:Luciferase-like monooxygenase